jgi:formate hydrogenlyase subunit 4
MNEAVQTLDWIYFGLFAFILPPLILGILRKTKARLQNRIGASILQPYYDLYKLFCKGETVSDIASWIFRNTAAINFSILFLIAICIPWLSFKPHCSGADLILVIYMFAMARFFTVLSALDTGSAFGGFGASREVTLAMLVEPAIMLCLASLACVAGSTDLNAIFSYTNTGMSHANALWLMAGTGLFLASLVELSRMPVDDPTTHLELTMIHEAMILENSGPNLALTFLAHYLKMSILWGVCVQCFMHACSYFWTTSDIIRALASVVGIMLVAAFVALIEGTSVKLRWTKLPEFIAFAVAMSLFCVFIAVMRS